MLNWFRLRTLESDLDRELSYHIDRRVSDLMRSGLPEPEARRQATLELEGATQVREEVRDIWLTQWLRDFAYDLRFSLRSFRRSPSFTATVVLSLALGIGATTAIYSLVDQVVLHALSVHEPERFVLVDWKGDNWRRPSAATTSCPIRSAKTSNNTNESSKAYSAAPASTINFSTGGEPKPAAAELV